MKQAVLYLTNKSNEWTLSAFHALEQSLQGKADVYFAYHQQGDVLPVSLQNIENQFVFTSDILSELGYTPIEEGKLVPGSNHFPLLKFFKENQGYDYYWLVEDDVRFSGEWKEFFGSLLRVHLISCLLSLKQRLRILIGIGGQVLKQAMKS